MIINASTFIAKRVEVQIFKNDFIFTLESGTVEVALGNEVRVVEASRSNDGVIVARGFFGHYQTSKKAWPAVVRQKIDRDGTVVEFVSFCRKNDDSKFKKTNDIVFA